MSAQNLKSPGRAAATGVLWLLLQTVIGRGVSLASQLILAKLLMPEDFGVLGLATTVITIFGVIVGVGIDQVIQQRGKWLHFWAAQAFGLTLILSILTALVMAGCAPVAAAMYRNDKLVDLILVVACSLPLQSLSVVPEVKLRVDLRFKFLAMYGSLEQFVQQIIIILLAWAGFGPLSFVVPIPILAAVKGGVFWFFAPVSFLPLRRTRGWIRVIRRATTVFGGKLCVAAVDQGDYIVLGFIAPTAIVGFYFFAFKLAALPMRLLASNFISVLFPSLVALKEDPARQRDAAFRAAETIGIVIAPICLLQAALAQPALTLLFGDRWLGSVLFLQILSIGLPLDAASWAAGSYLAATGQFAKKFALQLVFVPFFYLLVWGGGMMASATGVAIGVTLYYIIYPLTFSLLIFVKAGISPLRVCTVYLLPYAIGGVSFGLAYGISRHSYFDGSPIQQIIEITFVGGTVYFVTTYFTAAFALVDLKRRLLDIVGKKNTVLLARKIR